MNSEELELSLRTEFENHLKQISADMQQEISQLQEKVETEFERHKSQLDEVFQDFSSRARTDRQIDAGFRESVVEHLRLARDEGARITATAIAEAEDIEKESAAAAIPAAGISHLRDAINDISSQTSQAAILKALVSQAGQFTARGAFFIIKNEHFVGWRVFGREQQADDEAVRDIFFPVSNQTTLGESVKNLSAVEGSYGTYDDDSIYLDKLEFGEPDKMFAIPLVARGRGVAVLYADGGTQGGEVNLEALETLVRVAGLTVEVLAGSPGEKTSAETSSSTLQPAETAQEQVDTRSQKSGDEKTIDTEKDFQASGADQSDKGQMPFGYDSSSSSADESYKHYQTENNDFSRNADAQVEDSQPDSASEDFTHNDYLTDDYAVEEIEVEPETPVQADELLPVYQDARNDSESYSWNQPVETVEEPAQNAETQMPSDSDTFQPAAMENDYSDASASEFQFESSQRFESAQNQFEETPNPFESPQFKNSQYEPPENFSFEKAENNSSFGGANGSPAAEKFVANQVETVAEPVVAAAIKPARSRFSDKNVDLPIEVTEDERRLHNDARRFARLLVSEIKLYNEQKVREGRDGGDLYERLREAIDRSREMYDKRVQAPVAAKFDYFHYELVNTLGEGDEAKLGGSYPGAAV